MINDQHHVSHTEILIDRLIKTGNSDIQRREMISEIINFFLDELWLAEEKHPNWTTDPIHAISIMNEESGEAIKAAIDFYYQAKPHDHSKCELMTEISQTGAVAIRSLLHINSYQQKPAQGLNNENS